MLQLSRMLPAIPLTRTSISTVRVRAVHHRMAAPAMQKMTSNYKWMEQVTQAQSKKSLRACLNKNAPKTTTQGLHRMMEHS